jgi:hypothetical protein
MADITVTAAQVSIVFPDKAEIYDFIAGVTITKGQAVYQLTTGKIGLADANDAGKEQFLGIALNAAAAGKPVSVLKSGMVYGFGVSELNAGVQVFLSDTAGALADAKSATKEVDCGKVIALPDNGLTKVLFINADWCRVW